MTSRRALRWQGIAAIGLCATLLAGCGTTDVGPRGQGSASRKPKESAPGSDGDYMLVSSAGTWRVAYRTEPSPIPLNEPFSVFVRVARTGTIDYLPDVPVWVDASMPHHQHGMNRVPEQVRVTPELLRVDGLLFHMGGAWTLTFDVTQGAITERAEVVVEVP